MEFIIRSISREFQGLIQTPLITLLVNLMWHPRENMATIYNILYLVVGSAIHCLAPYKAQLLCVLLFQSISAQDENLSKTMFLPLAERMVEKMVKEDKIEAEAEVRH